MKKKVALTAAAVALVGTLAVGGTLAWFTDTEEATNVVTTGKIDVRLSEKGEGTKREDGVGLDYQVMPGKKYVKDVNVTNHKNDAYVRATITVSSESTEILNEILKHTAEAEKNTDFEPILNGLVLTKTGAPLMNPDSDGNHHEDAKWEKKGNTVEVTVYYVADDCIMTSEDAAWNLFKSVNIPSDWGNEFSEETFNINVKVQAIQSDNIAESVAWKNTINDLPSAKDEFTATASELNK